MKDYLPEDADIESVQGSLPLYTGKSQNITYTSDVESSYVILYTRITGHPASESYVITVNTSNYGTITIQAAIKLIDFAIESYNVAENAAYISVPVAGTYTVIFADYDDDRLSNVEAQEIIVTEAGIVPIRITEGFSLEQGDKIMLWSDLAEFKLFCEALTIE